MKRARKMGGCSGATGVGAGATGVAGSEALRGWRWRMGMAEHRVRNETILSSRGREAGDEGWGSSSALSVD